MQSVQSSSSFVFLSLLQRSLPVWCDSWNQRLGSLCRSATKPRSHALLIRRHAHDLQVGQLGQDLDELCLQDGVVFADPWCRYEPLVLGGAGVGERCGCGSLV